MTYSRPFCDVCVHRIYDEPGAFCKAFPKGIPDRYLQGGEKHNKKQPDQTGDFVLKTK